VVSVTEQPPRRTNPVTSTAVGWNVARLRNASQMTTRALAEKMVELGYPLSSSGVTDIERGRRTVSVDQLTALSVALGGVSPLGLLMPDVWSPDELVALSGVPATNAGAVYAWLRGTDPLPDERLDDYARETFRRRSNPEWTWRR
jgi:transcriptional regulator with XRE-family HTH domain